MPTQDHKESWRPPLAAELFLDSNGAFRDIVQKYRKLLPILPPLRRPSNGRSVEQELESWQAEASADPERKRQLFSVRYYLHDLLLRVTEEWLKQTSGVTNYVILLDQIRHVNTAGEAVCLVTFNYDLLLDRALLSFGYKPKDPEDEFDAHPIFKLLKPHGSVDWARYVDTGPNARLGIEQIIEQADSIKLTNKYLRADAADPRQMFTFEFRPSLFLGKRKLRTPSHGPKANALLLSSSSPPSQKYSSLAGRPERPTF